MTDADTLLGAPRPIERLLADIDAACAAESRPAHPKRIRAGAMGQSCKRALMFDFLWASPPETIKGATARIFQSGNIAEDRLLGYLRKAGWEVVDRNPENPRKQIECSFLDGHGFGYVDAEARDRVVAAPWMIVECKSHNEKSFKKLTKDGVAATKPEHFGQIQTYMRQLDIPLGMYLACNKNDDKLHIEYIRHDDVYTSRLLAVSENIVAKRVLPPKIGSKPDHPNCMFCRHAPTCHNAVPPLRNCRTCEHSKTLPGGQWGCKRFGCLITKELAPHGCADGYELAEVLKV